MTRPDLVKVLGGVAIGALLAFGVAMISFSRFDGAFDRFGGRSTRVTLYMSDDGCKLGKETFVLAKVSNDLTWQIKNRCNTEQTVAVGNFRTDAKNAPDDCIAKGPEYPFKSDVGRSVKVRARGTEEIKLDVVEQQDLPNGAVKYYFNICHGSKKIDPELEIEEDQY